MKQRRQHVLCFALLVFCCVFFTQNNDVRRLTQLKDTAVSAAASVTANNEIVVEAPIIRYNASIQYPYIPYSLISECGLAEFTSVGHHLKPISHSLGFVKTFKTGGSTYAGIINRICDGRDLVKPIPERMTYLGFPDKFPGQVKGVDHVMNTTKYDAVSNHAVFNATSFHHYLKDPAFFFTVLREPINRTISAYNYFPPYGPNKTWRGFIDRYFKSSESVKTYYQAVKGNSLAFSLGWYHLQQGGSRSNDQNRTAIKQFIEQLDHDLDLVLLLEYTAESLVLLQDHVPGLDITELVWYSFKKASSSSSSANNNNNETMMVLPTQSERAELSNLLLLDRMVYNHFRTKLLNLWKQRMEKAPVETMQLKEGLNCLRNQIFSNLDDPAIVPEKMNVRLTTDSGEYTNQLWKKQKAKFGIPDSD